MIQDSKTPPQTEPAFDIAADWLSWSIVRPICSDPGTAIEGIRDHIQVNYPELELSPNLEDKARPPYKAQFQLGIGGVVMFSHLQPHALIEITGRGCRHLENTGDFRALATRVLNRALNITRFDLAVDLETDTMPTAFVKMRNESRFKAAGEMRSETGITCYIGAPTGRRRARVYRYYPPHDRAHLLRVEMVHKKGLAGQALADYTRLDPVEFAAACGNSYGWNHSDWNFQSDKKITDWRPETGDAGTLKWLNDAVVPALEKLHKSPEFPDDHPIWRLIANNSPLELPTPDEGEE